MSLMEAGVFFFVRNRFFRTKVSESSGAAQYRCESQARIQDFEKGGEFL